MWLQCFSTVTPPQWCVIPLPVDYMMNTSLHNHKSILQSTIDLQDISVTPHFNSKHTRWRSVPHTHKHNRAVWFFFSFPPFFLLVPPQHQAGDAASSDTNACFWTFAEIVCMQRHSGEASASTCREWHMTSAKVIPEPSSASLLRDHSD